jgi:hypothetical protein
MRFFLLASALLVCASKADDVPQLHLIPDFALAGDQAKTDAAATTHYGSPKEGCEPDELAFSIMGVKGSVCAPTCSSSPCPTDLPVGTTAVPTCALQNPATGDKYCALICAPSTDVKMLRAGDGMCGAATCQPVQGTGICTYE